MMMEKKRKQKIIVYTVHTDISNMHSPNRGKTIAVYYGTNTVLNECTHTHKEKTQNELKTNLKRYQLADIQLPYIINNNKIFKKARSMYVGTRMDLIFQKIKVQKRHKIHNSATKWLCERPVSHSMLKVPR